MLFPESAGTKLGYKYFPLVDFRLSTIQMYKHFLNTQIFFAIFV